MLFWRGYSIIRSEQSDHGAHANHILTTFVANIHTRGLKTIESQMLKGIPTHRSHCVFGKPKRWSAHPLPLSNVDTVNGNDFCIYDLYHITSNGHGPS